MFILACRVVAALTLGGFIAYRAGRALGVLSCRNPLSSLRAERVVVLVGAIAATIVVPSFGWALGAAISGTLLMRLVQAATDL